MAMMDGLLDAVAMNGAESLLLTPGCPPRFRTKGILKDAPGSELDGGTISDLLGEVAPDGRLPETEMGSRWKFVYGLRKVGIGGFIVRHQLPHQGNQPAKIPSHQR